MISSKDKVNLFQWAARSFAAFYLFTLFVSSLHAQPAPSFLMVKYGDEAANPSQAVDFLEDLGAYLKDRVSRFGDQKVLGYIANREQPALELLDAHDPMLAFVSPGFYLAHLKGKAQGAAPVAQVPRFGKTEERYYLVGKKGEASSLGDLKSKTIRTHFSPDIEYLKRVVLPADFQPGADFTLEASENLADEVFMIIEELDEAADALLLDEELKTFFEEDDLVWPELSIVWTSEPLPRDLVVTLGSWNDAQRGELREALLGMKDDPAGSNLLDLMNSSGFAPVDEALLGQAERRYGER